MKGNLCYNADKKPKRRKKTVKELFLQGIGKIDCEKILGALWGLNIDLEKLQEQIEKIFSFNIQIEL